MKINRPPRTPDVDELSEWNEDVERAVNTLFTDVAALQAPAGSAYTVTNVTTDRAYDANATTVDELADVLGTLIADLKTKGFIS